MFPRVLEAPNRCADEIGSRSRNPQILFKNKNIILLQLGKILENRSANTRASALRESRMNKRARFHVQRRYGGAFLTGAALRVRWDFQAVRSRA